MGYTLYEDDVTGTVSGTRPLGPCPLWDGTGSGAIMDGRAAIVDRMTDRKCQIAGEMIPPGRAKVAEPIGDCGREFFPPSPTNLLTC